MVSSMNHVIPVLTNFLVVAFAIPDVHGIETLECDILASIPSDPNANASGVNISDIDPERAQFACGKAINDHPDEPRFKF